MYKSIIFDLDGVLIDSERKSVEDNCDFLIRNGVSEPNLKEVKALIGTTDTDNVIYMSENLGVSYEEAERIYLEYMEEHPFRGDELVFPEAVPLLSFLKAEGYILAVVSNSRIEYVEQMLKEGKIRGYFDHVISGRNKNLVKPDPGIYLYAAEQIGCKPEECFVIEDSPNGVQAARNAHMKVAGMYSPFLQLDVTKADYIVDNLMDVKNLLIGEEKDTND